MHALKKVQVIYNCFASHLFERQTITFSSPHPHPIHHPFSSYHSASPASYQGERQADCQGRAGTHRC